MSAQRVPDDGLELGSQREPRCTPVTRHGGRAEGAVMTVAMVRRRLTTGRLASRRDRQDRGLRRVDDGGELGHDETCPRLRDGKNIRTTHEKSQSQLPARAGWRGRASLD